MPMTLAFKRAKCFVAPSENDKGTKKFLANAGPANPIQVPFWVADTTTYTMGIKDGSIVNLTPPAQMTAGMKALHHKPAPVAEAPVVVAEPEPETEEAEVELDPAFEAAAEQTELPKAEFGAQPMTPVPPAPKVGGITPSSRKRS